MPGTDNPYKIVCVIGSKDAVNLRSLLNNPSEFCKRDELYKTPQRAQRTQSIAAKIFANFAFFAVSAHGLPDMPSNFNVKLTAFSKSR